MGSYELRIKASAIKELESIPTRDRRRVIARIEVLATTPRPARCDKISGEEKYRLRQGDDRILYSIDDENAIVTVVKIGRLTRRVPQVGMPRVRTTT